MVLTISRVLFTATNSACSEREFVLLIKYSHKNEHRVIQINGNQTTLSCRSNYTKKRSRDKINLAREKSKIFKGMERSSISKLKGLCQLTNHVNALGSRAAVVFCIYCKKNHIIVL